MSRTVPAVTAEYILTIGPRAHVMCVRRTNGDFLWGMDVARQYESEVPLWYTGQCPLIEQDQAIIATGGRALLVAVDCKSGEILWETPNPGNWKMSHSSVMPFEFGGRKMYVYSAFGGICGVAADGPEAGTILWETSEWNHQVVAPSPVCMPDGKIFITAGYGAGSMMLQLKEAGGKFSVEVLKQYLPKDGLACEQQTPIYFMNHLFGIEPKDAGALRNQLVCVHPSDATKIIWSSGQTVRFGMGPYVIADNKMYILTDDGTFTIVKPDTRRYIQMEQVKLFDGHDAWGPLAIADGYMVLRDSKTLFCLDLNVK
jgi:outer membrane protein assembly factor BamB